MSMRQMRLGYTLIEVMIVVAIIGVMASVAIPAFDQYTKKARIENLKSVILTVAAAQDRFFAARGRYTNTLTDLAQYGFKGSAEAKISIGVQITLNMGQGYWVAGSADIDKTLLPADPYNECWLFFGRNMPQPPASQGGFVRLWDDLTNANDFTGQSFADKDTVCK